MPSLFPHLCGRVGCGELTREAFCEQHAPAERRRYDDERGNAHSRGYDRTWAKVRRAVLDRDQWTCRDCGGLAGEVHHVRPIAQGGQRLDPENCVSLCHACHMQAERKLHKMGGRRGF